MIPTQEEIRTISKLAHGLIVLEIGDTSNSVAHSLTHTAFSTTSVRDCISTRIPGVEIVGSIPDRHFHIAFLIFRELDELELMLKQTKAPSIALFKAKEAEEVIKKFDFNLCEDFNTPNSLRLYRK